MRVLLAALLMTVTGRDARAILIDIGVMEKQTRHLQETVASAKSTDAQIHEEGSRQFNDVQWETPKAGARYRMDREYVDGRPGTVKDMGQALRERYEQYKLISHEVPPVDLENAVAFAAVLEDQKRVEFDPTGTMPDGQMGTYTYLKEVLGDGIIQFHRALSLIAARIGEGLADATFVHELTHAWEHAGGRLSPKQTKLAERHAYHAEWAWLRALDPHAERMIVLHETQKVYLQRHPGDALSIMTMAYLEHLLEVYDTHGKDEKIDELVNRRGYVDGDDDHDGGVTASASGFRA